MLRILSTCLLVLALSGCLATLPSASRIEPEPVPMLKLAYKEETPGIIRFLEFSEDGNYLVVANHYDHVGLYRSQDYTRLKDSAYDYVRVEMPDNYSGGHEIIGVGYIDVNTWYFAVHDHNGISAYIRSIQPAQNIFRYSFGKKYNDPVFVNENHIAFHEELIDWHSGQSYSVKLVFPTVGDYILTRSSRVLTRDWGQYGSDIRLDDPVHGKSDTWKAGFSISTIAITPNERHVIIVGKKGFCSLWQLPEKKEVERCGAGSFFRLEHTPRLTLSPNGERFAISEDKKVSVYRIAPFQLEMKAAMPDGIVALSLSDDGRLAAADDKTRLRLWDVATGAQIGQINLNQPCNRWCNDFHIALEPNSNKLAVALISELLIFELPEKPLTTSPNISFQRDALQAARP